jgi:class 3 adenylate cyclase
MPVTLEPGARVRIANFELVFDQTPDDEPSGNVDATLAAGSMEGHQAVLSVAILVCDIRGFSSMAEKLSERELAQIIGNWFRDIGNAVQSAGGIIDKYIGDALLAYWPARDQEGTECAVCLDVALSTAGPAADPPRSDSACEALTMAVDWCVSLVGNSPRAVRVVQRRVLEYHHAGRELDVVADQLEQRTMGGARVRGDISIEQQSGRALDSPPSPGARSRRCPSWHRS